MLVVAIPLTNQCAKSFHFRDWTLICYQLIFLAKKCLFQTVCSLSHVQIVQHIITPSISLSSSIASYLRVRVCPWPILYFARFRLQSFWGLPHRKKPHMSRNAPISTQVPPTLFRTAPEATIRARMCLSQMRRTPWSDSHHGLIIPHPAYQRIMDPKVLSHCTKHY